MHKLILNRVPFDDSMLDALTREAEALGVTVQCLGDTDSCPDRILSEADILFGYFPPRLLQQAEALRWYQLPCAGVDKFNDPRLYAHNNFTMTNASGAFGSAIAEQLIMGCLMLLRRMPQYQRQQKAHIWQRTGDLGFLGSSTIAVLGTGDLGSTFAAYAQAMGARVIGVNRTGHDVGSSFIDIYPVSGLLDAVSIADITVSCLPLTRETAGLMDRAFFAAMPQGALFLNVGRGKTLRQAALVAALQSGHLGGAMLDVTEVEPLPPESPLWDMENVIITPHISGSDLDPHNARITYQIFMDNLRRYVSKKPLRNTVDRNKGY